MVKIRASVTVGGVTTETPFIQSFTVNKTRGQVSTFSAALKIPASSPADLTGGDVVIKAGEGSPQHTIFTGICRAAKISPCFLIGKFVAKPSGEIIEENFPAA